MSASASASARSPFSCLGHPARVTRCTKQVERFFYPRIFVDACDASSATFLGPDMNMSKEWSSRLANALFCFDSAGRRKKREGRTSVTLIPAAAALVPCIPPPVRPLWETGKWGSANGVPGDISQSLVVVLQQRHFIFTDRCGF